MDGSSTNGDLSIICDTFDQWNDELRPFIPRKDTSLCRLSMVSLVTNLWSNGVLEDDLQNILLSNKSLFKERIALTQKAVDFVKKFGLPISLLQKLIHVLEWISFDFISYLDRLMSNEFFPYKGNIRDIVKNIKWDMHGGIDEVQTFKNMKYANYHYNYIVSTLYCLEDDIPQMWARLSPVYRPIFSLKKIYSGGFDSYATFIIYYWTCRVKKRTFLIQSLEDPIGLFNNIRDATTDLKMLVVSLHSYNIHSFKYFWYKLDQNERNIAITILCDIYEIDDLCALNNFYDTVKNSVEIILFVLSQVDDEQSILIMRRCLPQMIMNFWQCWQVHHLIVPMFEHYMEVLDAPTYKQLFHRLQMQASEYSPKNKLLYKMWLASPPHLQCLFNEEERREMFLDNYVGESRYDGS